MVVQPKQVFCWLIENSENHNQINKNIHPHRVTNWETSDWLLDFQVSFGRLFGQNSQKSPVINHKSLFCYELWLDSREEVYTLYISSRVVHKSSNAYY